MRILHLLNHIQEIGNGIVNAAVDLACLQAEAGHKVVVASAGGSYDRLLGRYGVTHVPLDQRRQPLNLLRAAGLYRTLVKTMQPDVVHAHMMTGIVIAWTLRGQSPYRLVSTVHNEFQRSAILMGLADRVLAVSQSVADSMAQRGIPQAKLRVVCNGTLGSPRERLSELPPVTLQHPSIATLAGMYHRKGIADLITAFERLGAEFPDAHLYLIGNGPDRAEFEAQAHATAVANRIHFEGYQAEPQRYLHATDIFVLASRQEPFGLVLSEARGAGCAIVASNVDGIPEALDGGKAGILVATAKPTALADAIAPLLRDSELLKEWKARSRRNLDWLKVARVHAETVAVYSELLSE
ncbi:glycosyltransferase family 4 protein [Stenomitos frigidus]|uniref:Glycosyltransferase n=1 Tax=Stenomitos frigidus ULC18 TaxID=2107698 RepID=A0A2T1DWB8_9CYAN|nr:glycosyltransferase family 4 protein [Stenomitos frigidus]PSB24803.1 glycosyltransferase [Stenomitos frigidus ULC18]